VKLGYFFWAATGILLSFAVSLVVVTVIVVKLPATFFLESHERGLWIDQHPVIRWIGRVLKNLLGFSLVLIGLFLSLPGIPGQGLLTMLIGLILIEFPGKRRLELAILQRPRIKAVLDRLRNRFGQPPLQLG
jgi:hypothetical protein